MAVKVYTVGQAHQRGGVLIETALVFVVLTLLIALLLDFRFAFDEQSVVRDLSRFGARIAAGAAVTSETDDEELYTYIREAIDRAITTAGLTPADYHVDVWPLSKTVNEKTQHYVQVTISRKSGSPGRFYLLPESWFDSCSGSVNFVESRKAVPNLGGVPQNPDCNPAANSTEGGAS